MRNIENKQTALEWLVKNFMLNGLIRLTKDEHSSYKELTDLAKQMEKEQIIDSYEQGVEDEIEGNSNGQFTNAEQYYNEKYGK